MKISYYLDMRAQSREKPLKLSISKNSSSSYIPVGISLLPEQWDKKKGRVKNHPRAVAVQRILDDLLTRAEEIVVNLTVGGRLRSMSAADCKKAIEDAVRGHGGEKFSDAYWKFVDEHTTESTRLCYQTAWSCLRKFCDADSLTFEDLGRDFIKSFDSWLEKRGVTPGSRYAYMSRLKAAAHSARESGASVSDAFLHYRLPRSAPRHRVLAVDELRRVFATKTWATDMFELSFMLVGMNTADMFVAKNADRRLEYQRLKTGKSISIKIEPEARRLIEAHAGKASMLDMADRYSSVNSLTIALNAGLRKVLPDLTMYYARHSWATVAAELDIPVDTISRALGHTFTTRAAVTSVYIEFDRRKIDAANRRVLDYVLYDKKG